MNTSEILINDLRNAGLTVECRAGLIVLKPKDKLTPKLIELVKASKPQLLEWYAAPWVRQCDADKVLAEIDGILKSIRLPADAVPRLASAAANVIQDCREMANEKAAARDWMALWGVKSHALWLANRIPEHVHEEMEIERRCPQQFP